MTVKPRILVLSSTLPIGQSGKEPPFVSNLSQELAKQFDVDVLVPHFPGAKLLDTHGAVSVYRYRYCLPRFETLAYGGGIIENLKRNPLKYLLVPSFFLFQIIAIVRLLSSHKYCAIHAHWIIPQGVAAVAARALVRKKDIPVVVTSHGGDLFGLNARPFQLVKNWVLKNADHITVVSQAMKQKCIDMNISEKGISVRSMGVDLQHLFIPPAPSNSPRNNLIYVGRLAEKKGVRHLLLALAQVTTQFPQIKLTIIGNGPERDNLERLASELGIRDSVVFELAQENHDIPAYLQQRLIMVMPSIVAKSGDQEGLGLTAVEAMGCECAVIASDLPAIHDVIEHGISGIMVPPNSSEALASAITDLLEHPEKMSRISAAGRAHALKHFDWGVVGHGYSELFFGLIANEP